ncbi:MAG: hypothetical protein ACRDN0_26515 [Trebonia sp.]
MRAAASARKSRVQVRPPSSATQTCPPSPVPGTVAMISAKVSKAVSSQ